MPSSVLDVVPLASARVAYPSLLSIRVWLGSHGDKAQVKVAALAELFQRKPGDTQIRLRLEKSRDFSVILDIPTKVRPDKELKADLGRRCT